MKAKPKTEQKAAKAPSPRQLCDAFGEEALLEAIRSGNMLAEIADKIGVSRGTLTNWINGDPERSARAREARADSAAAYDEMAYRQISMAGDPFELAKSREQAQHLRWRASKINPREYGDRQQITHDGALGIGLFDSDQVKRMAEQVLNAPD